MLHLTLLNYIKKLKIVIKKIMKNPIKFILLITIVVGSLSCGKTVLEPADAPTGPPPKEGDYFQGGYVIYVDNSQKHGLIGSQYDIYPFGIPWSPTNLTTGATAASQYSGANNTSLITAMHGAGTYAAIICEQYTNDGYADWYLPSSDETRDLYDNRTKLGLSGYYWSSTEVSSSSAYARNMNQYTGTLSSFSKSSSYKVRAVRKF